MKGLDTNILVRLITQDDSNQYQAAYQLIKRSEEPFFISIISVVELNWVLRQAYHMPRAEFFQAIHGLLAIGSLVFEAEERVREALAIAEYSRADLADILIGLGNRVAGCDTTFTFDKAASILDSFTQLA